MVFSKHLSRRATLFASAFALSIGVAACGGGTAPTADAPAGDDAPPVAAGGGGGGTIAITGAGATFPAPLYQRWFAEYNQSVDPNVQVSYQSVGSGAGLEQYINGTVDFGASDAPIQGDRLESFRAAYNAEPIQVPMAGGAVVLAYNLPGFTVEDEINLSREAYCGIVTGEVTQWNDPLITEQNEGVEFPDLPITFAHRSDGSGTTFIFVNHIAEVCPGWQAGVGTSVDWPTGVGGQGNEGVAAQIQQNEGTIGYVEYAYAKLNEIPRAALENASGNFIYPDAEAASLAFDGAEIPEDFGLLVPDPQNPDAFPIAGLTWIMIYPEYESAETWEALRNVLEWGLTDGQAITTELDYVPMPDSIVERVQETLAQVEVN
ncbi:phosphate ABC transporter substrate-binding protein PstS [filamentous cyanobacterium CCP1]|nr:phosphate ABC transporter substrate-binding protein PstS [filamentous cyanobacterium CCP2]PSB67649.1 phosphate ABC transporter substrate-binding protein PstS [filamentous cyanobacterium CCP1]